MKKIIGAALALCTIFAGCNKEPGNDSDRTKDEQGFVQLTISSKKLANTRGAIGTETATDEELTINGTKGLKVAVFNLDGSLDTFEDLDLTEQAPSGSNIWKTETFAVKAGTKYFFVFANDNGKITVPTASTTMGDFMAKPISVVYEEDGESDITVDDNFLLGTLWKGTTLAAAGGTEVDPVAIDLIVGRLSSKIKLADIAYVPAAGNPMKGTFSNGTYRIGTMPLKINTVGIFEGTLSPIGNEGVLVTSYAHDAAPWVVGGGVPPENVFNTTDYKRYAAFKSVNTAFYTTENTSAPSATTGFLYYGNSTYIQIETKYTPLGNEVYDPATLEPNASLASDGTFYMGYLLTGERLIFNRMPIGTDAPGIDYAAGAVEYKNGMNYHKFAIYDTLESDDVMKYRVLRNHYYEYNITGFKDIGSHTKEVDPGEPIPTTTTVEISVSVKHWDKVTVGNIEV